MKFEDKVKGLREKKYHGRETKEFLADVSKMAQGEAYEYLLSEVDFCGAKIDLSLRPMIPRPETEHWVGQVILENQERGMKNEGMHNSTEQLYILDLFAGSGCAGLAVLKNIPGTHVTFVEIDKKSKEQIVISLKKNKIESSRAKIIIEDVVEFLSRDPSRKFDLIFAIPPYVPSSMHDEVMEELHQEEPLYFFDKEDGFYFHTQVLKYAKHFLNDNGTLYLEFDITQRETIEQLAQQYGYQNHSFLKDPYDHECAIKLTK